LSNVIIVKLPFAVPNHPLIAGRIEQLKEQDSRIVRKRYGRQFIAAIPKCLVEVVANEVFD
jgi:Rad3-related DNA helicase